MALATAGDYYFTLPGLLLTVLGTLLAATKTILTNHLQNNLLTHPLHPLDLLLRMSPIACLQSLLYAHLSGELPILYTHIATSSSRGSGRTVLKVVGNGVLAFVLNIVSFTANKAVGALTMTVAGNLKQCLTVVAGIWVFRLEVGPLNAVGIVVALAGGAWYVWINVSEKKRKVVDELGPFGSEKEIV